MNRVYVTGMGIISSLGNGVESVFNSLIENRSGVQQIPQWQNKNGLHSHVAAPAMPYDISPISRSARRTMSPMSEMAVLAAEQALKQAQIEIGSHKYTPEILLCLGSTAGSPTYLEAYFKKMFERGGPDGQLGTTFFKIMSHSVSANVASALSFYGPAVSPSAACATSSQALIMGWELIRSGLYDIVIAGGADELHFTSGAVFDTVLAASRGYNQKPDLTPRPFDKNRDGLVVSEGASVVILESEESVKRRGVKGLAEFKGGAYLCNGSHMSQSNLGTMIDVMNSALKRADLVCSDVDYVNAHATGTVQGDQEEAKSIYECFGDSVPVSSLKGHFGHSLAACGALELICSIKMMEKNVLIPTRNLDEVDPLCSDIQHVKGIQPTKVNTFMSNNFAFGGISTSLVVSRMENNGRN